MSPLADRNKSIGTNRSAMISTASGRTAWIRSGSDARRNTRNDNIGSKSIQ
jgi:hypothetical protein